MALIYAMVLGADSIDDRPCCAPGAAGVCWAVGCRRRRRWARFCARLRSGTCASSTALLGRALERASWKAGAGPGDRRLVIDSFVGEVCGRLKQGAAYGYTRLLGYHPILATRADTREALHIRLRKGSAKTQKGMLRFCDELIARIDRAGLREGVRLPSCDAETDQRVRLGLREARRYQPRGRCRRRGCALP